MFSAKLDNVLKKVEKNKSLRDMDLYDYQDFFARLNNGPRRKYIIISEEKDKFDFRKNIVEVLRATNYKRGNNNWSSSTVVGFIQEVFDLPDDASPRQLKELSTRYNVPTTKLKSMVSFFLNLSWNTYNLDLYFTDYDCFNWKYRDSEKLEKAKAEDKLTDAEKEMVAEFEDVSKRAYAETIEALARTNLEKYC